MCMCVKCFLTQMGVVLTAMSLFAFSRKEELLRGKVLNGVGEKTVLYYMCPVGDLPWPFFQVEDLTLLRAVASTLEFALLISAWAVLMCLFESHTLIIIFF